MTTNLLNNSIWPTKRGKLGKNKVQIPDGVNTPWPDGDALVGNFVYKNGKIVGLIDSKALVPNDSRTSTIPYDYVDTHFYSIGENSMNFNLSDNCKKFTASYGSDNAPVNVKYSNCQSV
jgi:hypothetical protein